jgi:hypothetical protein
MRGGLQQKLLDRDALPRWLNVLVGFSARTRVNHEDLNLTTWQSVATRNYWLERATNLGAVSPFQTVATNIAGAVGTKTYTDTSATSGGSYFYRVGVQ